MVAMHLEGEGYAARLTRCALLSTSAACFAALFDALLQLLVRGGGSPDSWLCAFGLLSLVGVMAAAVLAPLLAWLPARWLTAPPPEPSARALLGAVAVGVVAVPLGLALAPPLVPLVPARFAYPEHVAGVLAAYGGGLMALALGALGERFGLGRESSSWARFLVLGVAASLATPHLSEVIGSRAGAYELGLLLLALSATFIVCRGLGARILRGASAAGLLCAALAFAGLSSWPTHRTKLWGEYPRLAALTVAAARLFDLDRDGIPAVLGGSDCNDLDPAQSPMHVEIVGNGIDDNCIGGDLVDYRAPPALARLTGAPSHDVIFVVLDAARADLLSARTMPRLFELSRSFAVFTRAYSNSNHTTASLLSLATGQFPMSAIVNFHVGAGHEPPLPLLLRSVGYRTLAAFQAPVSVSGGWIVESWFDEADREIARRSDDRSANSEATTDRAIAHIERLRAGGKPFLAWLHYLDMHEEYVARPGTPFSPTTPADRYHQEAFAVDRDLGRFLDYLSGTDYFTRGGLLVIHGDHGELLEEGRTGHATFMDEAVLRVPLLVRGPGVVPGRYDTRVNLVDLYPTTLALAAGISAPSVGRNLARVWTGADHRDASVIAVSFYQGDHLSVLIDGQHKLVRNVGLGLEQLYDLAADPGERHDLAAERPDEVARLRRVLGEQWDRSLNDRVLARRGMALTAGD
jgi:arylsulfatase A-like enzyme